MLRTVEQGLCLLGKSTIRPAQAQRPLVYLEPKWLQCRLAARPANAPERGGMADLQGGHQSWLGGPNLLLLSRIPGLNP